MPRLFLFCIGGTGHRVLKSLLMLLASGVQINAEEVIPIIFDPDVKNGDLDRTKLILENYVKIHKQLNYEKNNFFKTNVRTSSAGNEFIFNLSGVANQKFSDYIGLSQMEGANAVLVKALYSKKNLDTDLTIGFQGMPNIGSVVLNQIKNSNEFLTFASNFRHDDRIFIISSIFGGTGAAGFPILLKNLRNAKNIKIANRDLPNNKLISKAVIGAITVMPYFNVSSNNNSPIDSGTFITKTKAALEYYSRNLCATKAINSLYYIKDDIKKNYENNPGSTAQKNYAHYIELISALAVIDFMDDKGMSTIETDNEFVQAIKPSYKEFGLKFSPARKDPRDESEDPRAQIDFRNLGDKTKEKIVKPLTQYMYLNLYLNMQLKESIDKQPWSVTGRKYILEKNQNASDRSQDQVSNKLDKNFFDTENGFYQSIFKVFNGYYNDWLVELAMNERSFKPFKFNFEIFENKEAPFENVFSRFDESEKTKHIFQLVTGQSEININTIPSWFKNNFVLFDDRLNKYERKFRKLSPEAKFISTFYNATNDIAKIKLNIK